MRYVRLCVLSDCFTEWKMKTLGEFLLQSSYIVREKASLRPFLLRPVLLMQIGFCILILIHIHRDKLLEWIFQYFSPLQLIQNTKFWEFTVSMNSMKHPRISPLFSSCTAQLSQRVKWSRRLSESAPYKSVGISFASSVFMVIIDNIRFCCHLLN